MALPPRWRVRVGFSAWGRVLTAGDLAGSVTAANRALWEQPYRTATDADTAAQARYPLSIDAPVLVSVFDAEGDALALAQRQAALHREPRRTWRVQLDREGLALEPGTPVLLTWPRHGLAGGRTLIVRAVTVRGDRTDALLWG